MDKLEFLDGDDTAEVIEQPVAEEPAEQPEPQAEPAAEPEAKADRPRGPDGKFLPKEEGKPDPVMVPLAALHEVREQLRAEREQFRQAQQQQPQQAKVPDMFEDPEGFLAYQQQQFQDAIYLERLNNSYRWAASQHGQELVGKATEWTRELCDRDPAFNAKVKSEADPVGFAVALYQREQIASQVDPSEFQQFQAWKAAQAQAQAPQPGQQPSTPQPPQSIASLPSSGGATHVPVGPGQAFDSLFKK